MKVFPQQTEQDKKGEDPSKFIVRFFVYLALFFVLVGMLNYYIDPYGINQKIKLTGFNYYKPAYYKNTRFTKIFNSGYVQPNAIFLGNSRTEYLAAEKVFASYTHEKFYNYALSSGSPQEMLEVLKFSHRNFPIKSVYYGVDFIAFLNTSPAYNVGFDLELIQGNKNLDIELLKSNLSYQSLNKSYKCIKSNVQDSLGTKVSYQYNERGSRTNRWRELTLKAKGDKWLNKQFENTLEAYYEIYTSDSLTLEPSKMEALKSIVAFCETNDIELTLFLNPLYINQYLMLLRSPNKELYFQFLRELGNTHAFYNFSGINEYSSNKNNFWDSHHPRKHLAPVMASYIFESPKAPVRHDFFGKKINQQNVDSLVAAEGLY